MIKWEQILANNLKILGIKVWKNTCDLAIQPKLFII